LTFSLVIAEIARHVAASRRNRYVFVPEALQLDSDYSMNNAGLGSIDGLHAE
jgi:hypothetical protein